MLLLPPPPIKQLLLLLLSLSRVLDGSESGKNLVSEAVWVVGGDTAAPVEGMDLPLGSTVTGTSIDSASVCG